VLAPADENEGSYGECFPDVAILSSHGAGSSVAAAVSSAPLILQASLPEPIPLVSVEIRDVAERRLVTCIEVLSPTNKRGSGRDEYAGKRAQIVSGTAHLVEVDLLPVGTRFPTAERLPAVPYFVFISRAGRRAEVEVWPIAIEQPLPEVAIPLLPDDAPVSLDLQKALGVVYDIIGYDELLDYTQPPPGPLLPAEAAWVEEQPGPLLPAEAAWVEEQLHRAGRRKR
jgi:hypothetical protein